MEKKKRMNASRSKNGHLCRDCVNAYDFYEKGANGKPFLGKCQYVEFSVLLNYDGCDDNFKKR